jgi:hypothetical protein
MLTSLDAPFNFWSDKTNFAKKNGGNIKYIREADKA